VRQLAVDGDWPPHSYSVDYMPVNRRFQTRGYGREGAINPHTERNNQSLPGTTGLQVQLKQTVGLMCPYKSGGQGPEVVDGTTLTVKIVEANSPPVREDARIRRSLEDRVKLVIECEEGSVFDAMLRWCLTPVVRTKILLLLRRRSKDDHINC
jgi:hypothetical protein